MPRSKWKTNLVNAFPIPEDHLPKKPTQLEPNPAAEEAQADTIETTGTFPLFHLPPELRHQIYNLVLFNHPNPTTHQPTSVHDRETLPTCSTISLLHVCKRMHTETTHLLYSTTTFRLFPLQDFLDLPTPSHLPPHYRSHITRLSITFGPSWTKPPPHWRVTKGLARTLGRLRGVRVLKVFVTLDPSEPLFEKYRVSYDFYTDFCGGLLRDVLKAMPKGCEAVELGGYTCVRPEGPLVQRLAEETVKAGKVVRWSRVCGWEERMEKMYGNERSVGSGRVEDNVEVGMTEGMIDDVQDVVDGISNMTVNGDMKTIAII